MARLGCLFGVYKFLQFFWTWIWKVLKFTFFTVAIAFGSWVIGIPKTVQRTAALWSHEAMVAGVPSEYDQIMYYGAGAIALVMIVLGWVVSAYLTVWLVGLLF